LLLRLLLRLLLLLRHLRRCVALLQRCHVGVVAVLAPLQPAGEVLLHGLRNAAQPGRARA
jgi:hypothetical protein